MSSSCAASQIGAESRPALTLFHSTITVPLNFFGSVGRYTTMRVLYGAVVPGVTFHLPSEESGVALVYAVAVPERKYSACS